MTFQEWSEKHEPFWKHDARERLQTIWDRLVIAGINPVMISDILDEVISVMKNEYGE